MFTKIKLAFLVLTTISSNVIADDTIVIDSDLYSQNEFNYTYQSKHDDWIKIKNSDAKSSFSLKKKKNLTFGDELAVAWNLSDFVSLNFNVFENQYTQNSLTTTPSYNATTYGKIGKTYSPSPTLDINRKISGYKIGISSHLGLGDDYKLGFNLNYGQLEGADLAGFTSNEINTTSFGLGIRKNKFGASLNTDIFLENSDNYVDSSRLGIKFDWFFDDNTTISIGSQQSLNNQNDSTSLIDNITGSVQYIKFQHNL